MTIIDVNCPYCGTECRIMIEADSEGEYFCINKECNKDFKVKTYTEVSKYGY